MVFVKLAFHCWKDGPRNVFRPRLPPPAIELINIKLFNVGAVTMPVPSIGIVKVRRSPVTGSLTKIPPGFRFGRPGGLVPPAVVPTVSTPVLIVNGCPDCASVIPATCHPPKILARTPVAQLEENHGMS